MAEMETEVIRLLKSPFRGPREFPLSTIAAVFFQKHKIVLRPRQKRRFRLSEHFFIVDHVNQIG